MKNANQIRQILQFYVQTFPLKTNIADEENNFSVADNLFGSMILAIALNSEFHETENLGKVLRMLILDEYTKQNQTYPITVLKYYKDELNEFFALESKDAKLAFKYKLMDAYLTNLIFKKLDKIPKSQFLKEATIFFNLMGNSDDKKCKEAIQFYCLNYRLKQKKRAGWDNDHWQVQAKRTETIAEHIVSTMALAMAIKAEFQYDINLDTVLTTLALHETGETLIGDITPHDGMSKKTKEQMEKNAIDDALGNLEEKDQMEAFISNFMNQTTKEASFAYLCDKLDPVIQCKIYQDSGMQKPIHLLQNSKCLNNPTVKDCIKNGAKSVFDIWYETEKHHFTENTTFPEFKTLLKATKDNHLFINLWNGTLNETIELTEEEHQTLVKQIADITQKMYDDDNIDCVYLSKEQDDTFTKGNIHVVAVVKGNKKGQPYTKKINNHFLISVQYNSIKNSLLFDPDKMTIHARPTILFDKSGQTTKTIMHAYNISLWNQVEYAPPIEKPITMQLKKK